MSLGKNAFTLIELLVVMMIIGVGLMTFTPKFAANSVGIDERLEFFDNLIKEHLKRAIELGKPVHFTGFKGSENILTYEGKSVSIPKIASVQTVKVNGYETKGEEYSVRVYPDGICDSFEITTNDDDVIESIPLLMKTRYKPYVKE